MDRRKSARYPATLPVRLMPMRSRREVFSGTTVDLSREGILLAWEAQAPAPEIGEEMLVEVDLPSHASIGQRCLCCEGRVVRQRQPEAGKVWIALRVENLRFRDAASAPARPLAQTLEDAFNPSYVM